MKILIYNNTAGFHCGSTAVMDYMMATLAKEGHQIVGLVPNVPMNYGPWTEMLERPFDALVINGEGTMHHDSLGARRIAEAISLCLDRGKRVYLINTVWQENTCVPAELLGRLSGIGVRERLSALSLNAMGCDAAKVHLDFSYFRTVEPVDVPPAYLAETLVTDFYVDGLGFVEANGPLFKNSPLVKMHEISWELCVSVFQQAKLVVTGRHHGVYAACRARTPFAALAGNTHKIDGMIATSGIDIPIAHSPQELPDVIAWARQNNDAFERLFDWMEQFPKWQGLSEYTLSES